MAPTLEPARPVGADILLAPPMMRAGGGARKAAGPLDRVPAAGR